MVLVVDTVEAVVDVEEIGEVGETDLDEVEVIGLLHVEDVVTVVDVFGNEVSVVFGNEDAIAAFVVDEAHDSASNEGACCEDISGAVCVETSQV